MEFSSGYKNHTDDIVNLFKATFSASEGAEEGNLIADLVTCFFRSTKESDLFVFSAWDKGALVGSIIFSRLSFIEDARQVFILAPVAVETSRQGQGVGQDLLIYGLREIRKSGVDIAVTYGDPAYYSKVGFIQVTEQEIAPPLALQFPHGWQAQSLTHDSLTPLIGPSKCVEALNKAAYW